MSKTMSRLLRQLKTENRQDAEKCIKIYNGIKDITGGVDATIWFTMVKVAFSGDYPNIIQTYKPTQIGKIFLKGLNSEV